MQFFFLSSEMRLICWHFLFLFLIHESLTDRGSQKLTLTNNMTIYENLYYSIVFLIFIFIF